MLLLVQIFEYCCEIMIGFMLTILAFAMTCDQFIIPHHRQILKVPSAFFCMLHYCVSKQRTFTDLFKDIYMLRTNGQTEIMCTILNDIHEAKNKVFLQILIHNILMINDHGILCVCALCKIKIHTCQYNFVPVYLCKASVPLLTKRGFDTKPKQALKLKGIYS